MKYDAGLKNFVFHLPNKYVKVHALPKWYLDYIKNQILYKAAIIEMSYHETKNHNNYLRKVKINNQCAVLSSNYYGFINQYFFKLFQKEFSNKSVDTRHILGQTFLRYPDSLLTGEVRSIYRAYVISSFIIDYGLYDKAEKIIGKEGSGIESSKYVEYLKRYLSDREKLKSGTKAPNFYLLDSENNFKTLDDYQGNIVLLNFWFPGCTGCRIELSFEHKILDRYKNYNFKLINICFYSSGKNWRKALDQLGMRGVNLFANESWQNKLIQNYRIGSYPHYTLINVKGEIISNNPLRPSAGLSDEIQKFLAK